MIFVTVGTHEQQFNRLVREVDRLKKEGLIKEDVFIQTGYSDYRPEFCRHEKLLDYDDMQLMMAGADLIISHGGPSSFMKALYLRKPVIVVPREKAHGEHVNNHQLEFVNKIKGIYSIEVVTNVSELGVKINDINLSKGNTKEIKSYNDEFCSKFASIVKEFLE